MGKILGPVAANILPQLRLEHALSAQQRREFRPTLPTPTQPPLPTGFTKERIEARREQFIQDGLQRQRNELVTGGVSIGLLELFLVSLARDNNLTTTAINEARKRVVEGIRNAAVNTVSGPIRFGTDIGISIDEVFANRIDTLSLKEREAAEITRTLRRGSEIGDIEADLLVNRLAAELPDNRVLQDLADGLPSFTQLFDEVTRLRNQLFEDARPFIVDLLKLEFDLILLEEVAGEGLIPAGPGDSPEQRASISDFKRIRQRLQREGFIPLFPI